MAFLQRRLSVQFDLGEGTFGGTGASTLKLDGLRMSANITQPGIPQLASLTAEIYGMTLSQMNQLSTLGQLVTDVYKNSVSIFAQDDNGGDTLLFKGTIYEAWGDFNNAPEVPFLISAQAGVLEATAPYDTTNPKGGVAAADILKQFAAKWQGGMPFENHGVTTMLKNPYYYGSLKQQIFMCLQEARANWNGGAGNVFAVWPVDGYVNNRNIPTISKKTGMIQYPSYTQSGLLVRSLFYPGIVFGGIVKVETSLKLPLTPQGQWQVQGVTYNLQSLTPNGTWEMSLNLVPPGLIGTPPL